MPSSWITALKLYNSQETNINEPHKSVWAIPRKNTKAMEEVRALMPRGAPGGAKIVHGQKSKPLPTELKPETLTKLKQVEAETTARNAERKFAAKVKSIVDDIQGYIDIIEVGRTKTVGDKDKIVEARDAVLKRREQLADPKNKEIFEAMKDNKVMTYKIPDKVMKMKMSTEEEEEAQPEPEKPKVIEKQKELEKPKYIPPSWDKYTGYSEGDQVLHNGKIYQALAPIALSAPPSKAWKEIKLEQQIKPEPKEKLEFVGTFNVSGRRGGPVNITKSDKEKIEKMEQEAKQAAKEAKTAEEKQKIIKKHNESIKKLIDEISIRNVSNMTNEMSKDSKIKTIELAPQDTIKFLSKTAGKEEPKEAAAVAKELIKETKEPLTKVGDYSYNASFFNDLDEIFDPANSRLSTKKVQELRKKIGTDVYDSFANFARHSDLYPTPLPEVRRIVSDMMRHLTDKEKADGISFLEPSAGTGNILRGVIDAQKDGLKIKRIDACELQHGLYNLLKANLKIDNVYRDDFLEFKPDHHYDVIIMNPPFSGFVGDKDVKNLYTYHLFRAMTMKPRLIFSVMPRYDPKDAVTKYITSKYGPVPKYKVEQTMTINTFVDFKSGVPKPLKITAQVFRLEEEEAQPEPEPEQKKKIP